MSARIQPLADRITVSGSRSIIASSGMAVTVGALPISVRRAPERGVGTIAHPQPAEVVAQPLALRRRAVEQRAQFLGFGGQRLVFLGDLDLLEPPQRAQAEVEDRLGLPVAEVEAGDEFGLGLVFLADDADDLVDRQIGLEIAVEQFEPVVDLGQPEPRPPRRNLDLMVEIGLEHAAQRHHPWDMIAVEDIEI